MLRKTIFWLVVALILVYMTIPAAVVLMTSVSPSELLEFPPSGFSLRWYGRALGYDDFQAAFVNGLIVTAIASTTALLIGSGFAYLVDRYRFPGRGALEGILASPLIIPHFTTGLGFLLLGSRLGLAQSYVLVAAAHVMLVLPFVTRSVYVSLRNLDPNLERSAANLGASPWRVLRRVTMPLMVPGMVGGWIVAAILSFTEFTASLYVTAYRTQTLPVAMYTYIREYTDPTIAAISALLILVTIVVVILADRFLGLRRILSIDRS
ncbi:MAG TPA: ABC transporter permease [Alphaproteobacteria bacterium]|nr:ABC transporter permease [Alphaproteobacteria bacterium]